ncbi:hypothetical protein [Faecalimonas sp.]
MKFSIDQESVADIISSLSTYSDDINAVFDKFQDEIKTIAIRTNYNKLLLALQGIVERYNDVICGELRKKIISQWIEEGESLHAFAEDVYMGEESEEAARRIEASLEDIFLVRNTNSLLELQFEGDANATKEDFEEAVHCFESFDKEIDQIREENNDYFTNKIDDNELYRFLLPLIESIAIGAATFSAAAKTEMERLGDNYIEKMDSLKQRVDEAKAVHKPVDFDLYLFDFDDDSVAVGGTRGNGVRGNTNSVEDNKYKSEKHIQSIGEKMMKDFAPERSDCKKIEDIVEYANADNLEEDLRNFGSNGCRRNSEIRAWYHDEKGELGDQYKKKERVIFDKYGKLLNALYEEVRKELDDERKSLEKQYIKRTISRLLGIDLYQKSLDRANEVYAQRKSELEKRYNQERLRCNEYYWQRYNKIKQKMKEQYSEGAIAKCVEFYKKRSHMADEIHDVKNEKNLEKENNLYKDIKSKLSAILKECELPCIKFIRIYQDIILTIRPSVNGFSNQALGHRITINEKQKTWIDVNLTEKEAKNVWMDGILNMKTPVHEYLHYLSNGDNGTSGVKNIEQIENLPANERNIMRYALTGFNEGITEMFAQDYLRDEMMREFDFENVNAILDKDRQIIKQKSYSPQVDVIRSICKILGNNSSVKEAYIKHDFSIIERNVDYVLKKNGRSIDWNQVKKDMADIQILYTGGKPKQPYNIGKNSRDISKKIIEQLEG